MLFGTRSGIIYQKNIYVRYETSIIYVIILLVVLNIIEIIFKTTNNIITYIIEVSNLTYMFFW